MARMEETSMLQESIAYIKRSKKVTLILVAANVLTFLILSLMGSTESGVFMYNHGAAFTPTILQGEYWRVFTAMFLHFGLVHLLYNMLALATMGDMLERLTGAWKYLLIYLLSGLGGNLLSIWWDLRTNDMVISAGASGAIFGVIGALAYCLFRAGGAAGLRSSKRLWIVAALMLSEGFTTAGVDNAAHVGGLITGLVLAVLLYHPKRRRLQNRTDQSTANGQTAQHINRPGFWDDVE